MRAVTPRSVLNGVAARIGLDITQTVPAHTVAAFLEYINSAVGNLWDNYPFPEWTRIEARTYRAAYVSGTAYAAGDEVFYGGTYYRALVPTTGNQPDDGVNWEPATGLVQNVSLEQAGETAIGEILEVYGADPRVTPGATRYPFSLVEDGILVRSGPATVWLEFTLRPPAFAVADLDAATFPAVLAESVKLLAAAEAQREDGQFEKAGVLESAGMALFDGELDKIELKQGQQRRWAP